VAVKFNNAYFDALSRSAGVVSLVTAAAQKVAATARSTAPVDSGAYRDGIKVVLKYQRRAVALVVGTDKKTMLVESRTGNLARALKASGKGRTRG
jgi:hypothetical protein